MTPIDNLLSTSTPSNADIEFWDKLRRNILPLRPSQYDLTSVCNLTCEGCLFFSGTEYLAHQDTESQKLIDDFFANEAIRGVRYGYFGGAEPALVQEKLVIAARHIPYGVVFSNGTIPITREVPYRIHVSVWGNQENSKMSRGADIQRKQLRNYRDDKRAVFVLTVNAKNIGDIKDIAKLCADNGLPLSFNHYSPTEQYQQFLDGQQPKDRFHHTSTPTDNLLLQPEHLSRAKDIIGELIEDRTHYQILYNHELNSFMHSPAGLYEKLQANTAIAADCSVRLSDALRHYNTDLTQSNMKCCTPSILCGSCRLYAQSHATLLMRATRDMRGPDGLAKLIQMWRFWCALFLNDEGILSRD